MFITPTQYAAGDGEAKEPEDSETKKPQGVKFKRRLGAWR
jgi:hypothetical protein